MEKVSDILNKTKKYSNLDLNKEYAFGVSKIYYLKIMLFSLIILFSISKVKIEMKFEFTNIIKFIMIIILAFYIVYQFYTLFKYNICIKNKILIYEKENVDLSNIKSLKLMLTRVGGRKYDNCLELITNDKKRYIFRLNIDDKYLFIALISKISKVKVEV